MAVIFIVGGAKTVYYRTNNGGWNKSHGQVEKTPRLDSFQFIGVDGGCSIWSENIEIPSYRDRGVNPEIATIFAFCKAEQDIELSTIRGRHGGEQVFWICPKCGNRRRYLYLIHGQRFACRECARLNYYALSPTNREVFDGAVKLLLKQQNDPASVTAEDWAFLDKLHDPDERAECVSILKGERK